MEAKPGMGPRVVSFVKPAGLICIEPPIVQLLSKKVAGAGNLGAADTVCDEGGVRGAI